MVECGIPKKILQARKEGLADVHSMPCRREPFGEGQHKAPHDRMRLWILVPNGAQQKGGQLACSGLQDAGKTVFQNNLDHNITATASSLIKQRGPFKAQFSPGHMTASAMKVTRASLIVHVRLFNVAETLGIMRSAKLIVLQVADRGVHWAKQLIERRHMVFSPLAEGQKELVAGLPDRRDL